jgi:hypothetical protein
VKKILGKVSWIVAFLSVFAIVASLSMIDSAVFFYTSIIGLVAGIVGICVFSPETKKRIIDLFELLFNA